MMNKRFTVIFDFDGTLADTLELMLRLYNESTEEFGTLPVDINEVDELRALGYKGAMKRKKIRLTKLPKLAVHIIRVMKQHMHEVSPHEGIIPMLQDLQKRGISIGVLTSNNAALVQDFFDANGFPEFDFVVSEKTLFGKEKALRRIMKRHRLKKERVVYVGDEPRDVYSSQKAGIKVFGVTWGLAGRIGFQKNPPDRVVDNAEQLHACIIEAIQ